MKLSRMLMYGIMAQTPRARIAPSPCQPNEKVGSVLTRTLGKTNWDSVTLERSTKFAVSNHMVTHAVELEPFEPDVDMRIDAGIRRAVCILRKEGIETFESCEGGEGHCFPEPTIRFHGNNGEGFKALSIALTYGLPVLAIRRAYSVVDNEPTGPYWEIVFRSKDAT